MEVIVRIFFDKTPARRNKDGLIPIRLCITHRRERKYYSIRHKLKNNDWQFISEDDIEKVHGNNPRGVYRKIKDEFNRIVKEAEDIINEINVFSFNQFEDKYYNKVAVWDNVYSAAWDHIKNLKAEGRLGYASTYESTLRAIKEFHNDKKYEFNPRNDKIETREKIYLTGKPLHFVDITPTWLKKFERHLRQQGKSNSTIGIYTRNIRVLFNLAIKEHSVRADYPFIKYSPLTAEGRKIALSAHQRICVTKTVVSSKDVIL